MIILYVAHLNTHIAAGPNWSVPARVVAQSKYDNVLLLNTTNVMMEHWKEVKAFHNLSEFVELHLQNLPEPFTRPDIVVFEGFNFMEQVKFAKELKKAGVPYVITPRGAMTYDAQHNHAWLKKRLARWLFLDRYIKNARAIQYLTEGECASSRRMFNTPYYILPNGFNKASIIKQNFSEKAIKATFIGRLDMHHKGIDLLLNAMASMKEFLEHSKFKLDIYGPKRYDYYKIEEAIRTLGIETIAEIHDEVGGKRKEQVLLSTDLFVMTSRLEGLPMGLLEAFTYGVPCFVTRGTNMKEAVDRADAGWTCEVDEEEIKNTLIKIVEERNLLKEKGLHALALSEDYQWDKIALKFHKEVEKLIQ